MNDKVQEIRKALERYQQADDMEAVQQAKFPIELDCVEWLSYLLTELDAAIEHCKDRNMYKTLYEAEKQNTEQLRQGLEELAMSRNDETERVLRSRYNGQIESLQQQLGAAKQENEVTREWANQLEKVIDEYKQENERLNDALYKYADMIVLDTEDRPHDVGQVAREVLGNPTTAAASLGDAVDSKAAAPQNMDKDERWRLW